MCLFYMDKYVYVIKGTLSTDNAPSTLIYFASVQLLCLSDLQFALNRCLGEVGNFDWTG